MKLLLLLHTRGVLFDSELCSLCLVLEVVELAYLVRGKQSFAVKLIVRWVVHFRLFIKLPPRMR